MFIRCCSVVELRRGKHKTKQRRRSKNNGACFVPTHNPKHRYFESPRPKAKHDSFFFSGVVQQQQARFDRLKIELMTDKTKLVVMQRDYAEMLRKKREKDRLNNEVKRQLEREIKHLKVQCLNLTGKTNIISVIYSVRVMNERISRPRLDLHEHLHGSTSFDSCNNPTTVARAPSETGFVPDNNATTTLSATSTASRLELQPVYIPEPPRSEQVRAVRDAEDHVSRYDGKSRSKCEHVG